MESHVSEIRVHFTEFLDVTKDLRDRPRLVDVVVKDGYVHMDEAEWEKLRKRSEEEPIKPVDERERIRYVVTNKTHVPPCIRLLMEALKRGVNIPHAHRFAVASFLLRVGVSSSDVESVFQNTPNYNPVTTHSQVEQIRRGDYAPPNCAHMLSAAACVPDEMCCLTRTDGSRMVSHPLHYVGLAIKRNP